MPLSNAERTCFEALKALAVEYVNRRDNGMVQRQNIYHDFKDALKIIEPQLSNTK